MGRDACVQRCISYIGLPETQCQCEKHLRHAEATKRRMFTFVIVVATIYDVQSSSGMRSIQVKATWSRVEGGSHDVVPEYYKYSR